MIYLDANASSRLRPAVCEFLRSAPQLYNPSSVHTAGRNARAALRDARSRVLALAKAPKAELIFTSSGTEACNLMLYGFLGQTSFLSEAQHNINLVSAMLFTENYLDGITQAVSADTTYYYRLRAINGLNS